jgi:hypothetical protein
LYVYVQKLADQRMLGTGPMTRCTRLAACATALAVALSALGCGGETDGPETVGFEECVRLQRSGGCCQETTRDSIYYPADDEGNCGRGGRRTNIFSS